MPPVTTLHPMRVVMHRTGLTADVLRAWEKRYGAVSPQRSDGGQRLYTDDEVERLTLLHRLTELGRPISQIATFDARDLRAMLVRDEAALPPSEPSEEHPAEQVRRTAMACTEQLDGAALEALLRRAGLRFGTVSLIEDVLVPFLHRVGERWHRDEITVAHEHVASATAERVLQWLLDTPTQSASSPLIAVATTEGERHALGIQIAAAIASAEAWRVFYLGADLPASAIIAALQQRPARVLAVSLISSAAARAAPGELRLIREALPPETLMVAGGAASAVVAPQLHTIGIRVVPNLADLRTFLAGARQG